MKFGYLSQVFSKFAWKRITAVEVLPTVSHGHEFNSSKLLREILGTVSRKSKEGNGIPTKFVYLCDSDEQPTQDTGNLSWYDSRVNQAKRSPEWRLYYTDNAVIGAGGRASVDDSLVIAFSPNGDSATVLIAKAGSTSESQLLWLFGLTEPASTRFKTADIAPGQDVDMARIGILDAVGVEMPTTDNGLLERMQRLFGGKFPKADKFSSFVRKELSDVRAEDGADKALIEWMEREEFAFRILEKALVGEVLKKGFKNVDDFVSSSLSVQNRRKARAGLAFENHLSEIFRSHGLVFERGALLENKAKPDFLFPGKKQYDNTGFPISLLTLLGAKTTCKDRWRQVLAEGKRFTERNLVTIEPAISANQLAEMRANNLQLVIPGSLHGTYPSAERAHLLKVSDFIALVHARQAKGGIKP